MKTIDGVEFVEGMLLYLPRELVEPHVVEVQQTRLQSGIPVGVTASGEQVCVTLPYSSQAAAKQALLDSMNNQIAALAHRRDKFAGYSAATVDPAEVVRRMICDVCNTLCDRALANHLARPTLTVYVTAGMEEVLRVKCEQHGINVRDMTLGHRLVWDADRFAVE